MQQGHAAHTAYAAPQVRQPQQFVSRAICTSCLPAYATQVGTALDAFAAASFAADAGDYAASGAAAAAARRASESAFAHPAMLTQLNTFESHELGVYMPLFLPMAVPLLQGLLGQVARYTKRSRAWRAMCTTGGGPLAAAAAGGP